MATKPVRGDIDTTYTTHQRDMFTSGLVAEIGGSAFTVWNAIKWHCDFNTGESYPGIRRIAKITGMSTQTVENAIKKLISSHLLRISRKKGQQNVYVARERIDVRVGNRVISTIVVDFIPDQMRERLAALKRAGSGISDEDDVWAQVELLPGPGMTLDALRGTFIGSMRADEIPEQVPLMTPSLAQSVPQVRDDLRKLANQLRKK